MFVPIMNPRCGKNRDRDILPPPAVDKYLRRLWYLVPGACICAWLLICGDHTCIPSLRCDAMRCFPMSPFMCILTTVRFPFRGLAPVD